MEASAAANPKPINRVILACVQCRGRHVKCDATQPVCNRCRRDGKECIYQKSRRGGLTKDALERRKLALQQRQQEQQEQQTEFRPQYEVSSDHATNPSLGSGSSPNSSQNDQMEHSTAVRRFNNLNLVEPSFSGQNSMSFAISKNRLLDLYYENFWPAFPFPLPSQWLNQRKLSDNNGLDDILIVMQWIGAIFAPWTPSESYYQMANEALNRHDAPKTPFFLQALMICSVAQSHLDLKTESRKTLVRAISLGLELGINKQEFAQIYGEGNPVLEESWRRTYYFLHIIDQHYAVTTNSPMFAMRDVPNSVDLPCDDEFYEMGQIPPTMTFQQYEMREFDDVDIIYSSITYLYDICNCVSYIMRCFLETGTFGDTLISAIDAKVAIWQSLLPACKKDPLQPDGRVDEVMFMAHMIAAILIMTTHRPFSSLIYSIEELSTESFVSPVPFIEPLKQGQSAHTARALKAADMQTKLLAIPCPVERHNLFAMCIAAQLATAQISACNVLLEDHALSIARDRVRLSIGYLKAQGMYWPLARRMANEVRFVARRTLAGEQSSEVTVDPNAEIEIPRDELIFPVDPSAQIDIYSGLTLPINWDASLANFSSSNTSSMI